MFEITGKIKLVQPTQQVTDKFKKREFVLTDESSQYPQDILFQLTQDRCELLDGMNPGDEIKVNFNLRGREWTSPKGEVRYFNSLDVWRLEAATSAAPSAASIPPAMDMGAADGEDDLPF